MRYVFHLKGLDCAGCATKIETAAGNLDDVKEVVVDFSTGRILLDAETTNDTHLLASLREIIAAVEPGVTLTVQKQDKHRLQLAAAENIVFALGLFSFIAALFFSPGVIKSGLFLSAYLLAGFEVIQQAFKNIRMGQIFDEHFLMSLATLGALAIGEFPEAASVMIFYRSGEFLQGLAVDRSRRSISALIAVRPEIAHRKTEEGIKDIPVEEVSINDTLLVRPGERVPVDGVVLEGSSLLDASALTGESMPQSVSAGEEILAGCINLKGLLTIQASKAAADSTVSRILDLVENAAANKAPTEDFITSFARYYTPVVVAIALLIAAIPPLFLKGALFSDWFYRALIFLVISCPCALVVSIPLGFFGGIGKASKQGILVKGSNYLQALQEVDTVVFDKTGTLTSGRFTVQEVLPAASFQAADLLRLAAYAESASSHPLAQSILKAYPGRVEPNKIQSLEEFPGLGVRARIANKEVLVGSRRLLEEEGVEVQQGQQAQVHLAVDGLYAGAIILSDNPKKDAAQTVRALKEFGIKEIVMLSGDSSSVAEEVGRELGIFDTRSELFPEDKVTELEKIIAAKKGRGKVAFVGDGINDAPAIARAHVGIAMGALGSEAAIETADVVLMNDQPLSIVDALRTAKDTNRIVWQNIILAFGVKLGVLILGALGLATLWEAVFADVGVTILAVLNSVRNLRPKTK